MSPGASPFRQPFSKNLSVYNSQQLSPNLVLYQHVVLNDTSMRHNCLRHNYKVDQQIPQIP